ncbi:hypothetical protein K470DRAFT_274696 [Piedraia hortae CBS 480.64]|uniref:Uncharacterized protein n=1 Tax=Piedraia hortae CBS 480.64 TaxID=1314780 RepID=A0A6A7C6K6_9PEZI|nr:hypothetical protein K470DRAFT_274696 [Piedraia hortae CBS 480.64]
MGPLGSSLKDVVDAIGPALSKFEEGGTLNIGQETTVFAFVFAFLGDTPQQQKNCDMLSHNAIYGCRQCFASTKDGNRGLNTTARPRCHYEIKAMRAHMRQKYRKYTGLCDDDDVPLSRLAPALDLHLATPADPAHSELNGISNLMHHLLKECALIPSALAEYKDRLGKVTFPPGWIKFQNPVRYLGHYSLLEHGRWSIVALALLRVWLRDEHILPHFAEAMKEFGGQMRVIERKIGLAPGALTVSMMNTYIFSAVADTNILESRGFFQAIAEVAALASLRNPRSRESTTVQGTSPSTLRSKEWHGIVQRPNVHIGLHYAEQAAEYGSVWLCNALMGEDKHRLAPLFSIAKGFLTNGSMDFKHLVQATNFLRPERGLLVRMQVGMTMRHVLGGSLASERSELTAMARQLH